MERSGYEASFDKALSRCQAEWENKTPEVEEDEDTEDDIPGNEDLDDSEEDMNDTHLPKL